MLVYTRCINWTFLGTGVKQNFETRWIGWPGLYVPDEAGRKSLQKALADKVRILAQ